MGVGSWTVACGSCRFEWRRGPVAHFEQEAVESRPCPGCGAYTLSCHAPKPTRHLRSRTDLAHRRPKPKAA